MLCCDLAICNLSGIATTTSDANGSDGDGGGGFCPIGLSVGSAIGLVCSVSKPQGGRSVGRSVGPATAQHCDGQTDDVVPFRFLCRPPDDVDVALRGM